VVWVKSADTGNKDTIEDIMGTHCRNQNETGDFIHKNDCMNCKGVQSPIWKKRRHLRHGSQETKRQNIDGCSATVRTGEEVPKQGVTVAGASNKVCKNLGVTYYNGWGGFGEKSNSWLSKKLGAVFESR